MRREPPVLDEDVLPEGNALAGSSDDSLTIEQQTSLLTWTQLAEPIRLKVVSDWVSGRWASLHEFCRLNYLSYYSIRNAFQVRGVPTSIEGIGVGSTPGQLFGEKLLRAGSLYIHTAELAAAQIAFRLATEHHELVDLLKISSRMTTDGAKVGFLISTLAEAEAMSNGEITPDRDKFEKRASMPAEVKKALDVQFANVGERIVKGIEAQARVTI